MNRAVVIAGALWAVSCTELSARWNDHRVFFGTVRESGTETTLATFCAETSVEHSDAIVFSAPGGTTIAVEVVVEGRTEKYWGVPPERAEAFWCTDVPQVYLHPVAPWICLRAMDDDPPATILGVQPRGQIAVNGSSSGYALELQVRHPGVLRVVFDEQCLLEHSAQDPDAGAPLARGEVTIQ